eukprot:Nk52_evm9s368 gene=Nk52_evmTU9s368
MESFKESVNSVVKLLPGNFKHVVIDWRVVLLFTICCIIIALITEKIVAKAVVWQLEKEREEKLASLHREPNDEVDDITDKYFEAKRKLDQLNAIKASQVGQTPAVPNFAKDIDPAEERRLQSEQLAKIFELAQKSENKNLGLDSMEDIAAQMKMYTG